jgi:hypothetical protein
MALFIKELAVGAKTQKVTNAEKTQRRFVRLAILELEKVRRNQEMDRGVRHVKKLRQRLLEIEQEQNLLLVKRSPDEARQTGSPAVFLPPSAITISY